MLQKLRSNIQHQSPALVLAGVALFVALGGGSYAALSSGGGDHNANAAKKGKRGPAGPTGPAGPAGATGATGAQGPAGSNAGFPGTLPSGETLTGTYIAQDKSNPNTSVSSSEFTNASISFVIPLASAPAAEMQRIVPFEPFEANPAHCPGTPANPSAAPGFLCIYEAARFANTTTPGFCPPDAGACSNNGATIPSKFGVILDWGTITPNIPYGSHGSWAVTAL